MGGKGGRRMSAGFLALSTEMPTPAAFSAGRGKVGAGRDRFGGF